MCPPPCGPRRSPGRSRISTPSCKYAAKFKISYLEVTVASDTLVGLIDQLWKSQDLSCLSRQSQMMGTEGDVVVAERLDRFLEKYYAGSLRCKDIQDMQFDFSIGSLMCVAFATNKEDVLALMAKK